MEGLKWLLFLDIMEFTADMMNSDKNILPSLWNFFTMLKIECWWNKKEKDDIKQTVKKVAIRCSNCKK